MDSLYATLPDQVYHAEKYPKDHWALQPCLLDDPKVIALAFFKEFAYGIYLNPMDKRGYRAIVRLIKNDHMESTLNRSYTSQERIGLGLTMQLVAHVYNLIVPISQISVAGNNSHNFDKKTGQTFIGKCDEPSFLHGHIYGRGNPQRRYIDDVKLDGPVPGLYFDMMAKNTDQNGDKVKVTWAKGEMEKVVKRLRSEIEKIKKDYVDQGLTIITA